MHETGTDELREIEREIEHCYNEVLKPMDQWGLVSKKERCKHPMVLIIGNYSSGKSTFVNSLTGGDLQKVGAAPTDAGFTLLLKGKGGEAKGSAVIGDPVLGFEGLRRWSSALDGKLRMVGVEGGSEFFPENMLLVDTPGFTDSGSVENDKFPQETVHEIIYWLSTRSDMILFFFDPEKPNGSEQQKVLTHLYKTNMEGKIKFIFSKVDKLKTTQDLLETFGTLCWTMSKFCPRKELPTFYTIYTPNIGPEPAVGMQHALEEAAQRRDDLLTDIIKLPSQRADNLIEQTEDAILRLRVAGEVCNELLLRGWRRRRTCLACCILSAVILGCVMVSIYQTIEVDDPFSPLVLYSFICAGSVALLSGGFIKQHLDAFLSNLLTPGSLDECHVVATPAKKNSSSTSDPESTWRYVASSLSFTPTDLSVFSKLKKTMQSEFKALEEAEEMLRSLHDRAEAYRTAMEKQVKVKTS